MNIMMESPLPMQSGPMSMPQAPFLARRVVDSDISESLLGSLRTFGAPSMATPQNSRALVDTACARTPASSNSHSNCNSQTGVFAGNRPMFSRLTPTSAFQGAGQARDSPVFDQALRRMRQGDMLERLRNRRQQELQQREQLDAPSPTAMTQSLLLGPDADEDPVDDSDDDSSSTTSRKRSLPTEDDDHSTHSTDASRQRYQQQDRKEHDMSTTPALGGGDELQQPIGGMARSA